MMLDDEQGYIRAILDAQPAITIFTDGKQMMDANAALFRLLTPYQTVADFRQDYDCICQLFESYQDPLGHTYLSPNQERWIEHVLARDHRATLSHAGQRHHFMVRARLVETAQHKFYVVVLDDITEHVLAQLELKKQLITDITTGLLNRFKLFSDMEAVPPQAMLVIKILEFVRLNEVYGLKFTDMYLQVLSERLRKLGQPLTGFVGPYRLSDSEFAYQLMGEQVTSAQWEQHTTQLINDLTEHDLSIWGASVPVIVAAGLSIWDSEVDDVEQLLLQASMAMNRAWQQHALVLTYDTDWRERQKYQQAQEWLEKVGDALADDQIEPVFQPIYNQALGIIDKYECLVRMRDRMGQLISPDAFLNSIRHTREYLNLTQVMFEKSCQIFANLTEHFTLNLSGDDFRHTSHLNKLLDIIQTYQVGHRLTLEVVESEEIASYQRMIDALTPFRAIGCGVAIDDFGSGYANFAHVSGLQADILKIDGTLIQAMASEPSREVVVQGLVEFAHRMGMKVVAEFVSTPQLWQRLSAMGVDAMQGFAISHPIDQATLMQTPLHINT